MIDLTLSNAEYLLTQFKADKQHAIQVKKIALMLFDETKGLIHELSNDQRKKLEIAALLHDIGRYYGEKTHNQYSYEMIIQNSIDNVKAKDLEIIANIAKYHKGAEPSLKHQNFEDLLDKESQLEVRELSSFLRIADGLDREHLSTVENIKCSFDKTNKILKITINENGENYVPNLKVLLKKKGQFEKVFGVQLLFN